MNNNVKEWLIVAAIVIPIMAGAFGFSYLIVETLLVPIAEEIIKDKLAQ